MTSVTGTALDLYLEGSNKAKELAQKNGIPCTVDIPFGFKGRGMKSKIIVYDDKLYVKTLDKNVNKKVNGKKVFSKDHLLTRYLLQNAGWGEGLSVEFTLLPAKTLDFNSLRIKKIKQKRSLLTPLVDSWALDFYVPVKNVDVLDTVFYMYTGREPKLEDFLSKKMIKGHSAEAYIKELPALPQPFTPPEIKTEEAFVFPVERIVKKIEDYRRRAIEKYKRARRDIKAVTGKHPTEISCGMGTKFWENDGLQFSGRVAKPSFFGPLLDHASIQFPGELSLYDIGRHVNGKFTTYNEIEVAADDYLNAKSALDLIEGSSLIVGYSKFEVRKDQVSGASLKKGDIRKMFELAAKISSVAG